MKRDIADAKDRIEQSVRAISGELAEISHKIHARPELGFEEHFACQLLCDWLESKKFQVRRGAFGLGTAFVATKGSGQWRFAVCAEYDALPEIGHACGHNVIAAAAAGAGVGAAQVASELGFEVVVIGTPAEETAGGKAILVERGAFEGIDAAMMVHPAPVDILDAPYLAVADLEITCIGRASHASLQTGSGGGNALDGIVDTYSALRRLDLGPYERCAGVITEGARRPTSCPSGLPLLITCVPGPRPSWRACWSECAMLRQMQRSERAAIWSSLRAG